MLKNYLWVAFRNLVRHRIYTVINLAGLIVGMTGCVLVFLFVADELSYDSHHANGDRVYRLIRRSERPDAEPYVTRQTSGALSAALIKETPGIEAAARVMVRTSWVHYEDKRFELPFWVVDPSYFDLFTVKAADGNPKLVGGPRVRASNTVCGSTVLR